MTVVFAARRAGVLAGLACARLAMHALDPQATFTDLAADGDAVSPGQALAKVEGAARAILSAERTALNLLGRLSGVATLARAYVDAVAGTRARITDTRKTTPGLRQLEKYAVRCGGGVNHRFGLDDAILIKDNHVAACGGVAEAVRRAKAAAGHLMKVEVEIDSLDQLEDALLHRRTSSCSTTSPPTSCAKPSPARPGGRCWRPRRGQSRHRRGHRGHRGRCNQRGRPDPLGERARHRPGRGLTSFTLGTGPRGQSFPWP
jgi:hypothetical protein